MEKKNDFLFSIIVPIYKTEKYLIKCLDSILKAIDTDCEVVLINDGSPDNSDKIIKKFLKELPDKFKSNFVYKKKINKGLADTKNLGISIARGEYISVVDSDDTISENFYADARPYIKKGYDVIIYDLYIVFENNPEYNHTSRAIREDKKGGFLNQILHGAMLGSSCNKIIQRKLYTYKFPVGMEYEDVAVTPFILVDAEKIKYIPNPNYYYLQREKSIVAKNTLEIAFFKICKNVNKVLEKKGNIEKYAELINVFYIDRTIDMLDYALKRSRKKFIKYLIDFHKDNAETINYIIRCDIIIEKEALLTKRQCKLLKKIYQYIDEKKYYKLKYLLIFRRVINWFRAIWGSLKQFIKIIIGGVYYG